jgi:hypothetical protein
VNLLRNEEGIGQIRIVWHGDLVTEVCVAIPIRTLRNSQMEVRVVEEIRQLTAQGVTLEQVLQSLNGNSDLHPCRGGKFTPQIVHKLKRRFRIVSNLEQLRSGALTLSNAYTLPQMAKAVEIDPSWFYRKIGKGEIRITKNEVAGCYLFPKSKKYVMELKRLRKGGLSHVTIPEVHFGG